MAYQFYSISLGYPSYATGISSIGEIVAYDLGGRSFTFSGGHFTTFKVEPDDVTVYETHGINNAGRIELENSHLGPGSGFLFQDGVITNISPHIGLGINDQGQYVGITVNEDETVDGFLFLNGAFTPFNDPDAADHTTVPTGINDGGTIVGHFQDELGFTHGFVFSGGNFDTITFEDHETFLTGINDAGQIVGYYLDGEEEHGLLFDDDVFTTIDAPLGDTELTGIDNFGQIVGNYIVDGVSHGFLATTLTPPAPSFSAESASITVFANFTSTGPTTLTNLIPFTENQFHFGQQAGVLDPIIYAYEALGATLATGGFFQNTWGPTKYAANQVGDADFVFNAYEDIFGHEASQAQSLHFIEQLNFFESIYAASGAFGDNDNIHLVARGAIYGQMLGFQSEAPLVGIPAEVV